MSWQRVTFMESDVEQGGPGRLEKEYRHLYAAAQSPRDAAVFSNELAHEGIEYYFSPEASRIAEALLTEFAARPCDAPASDDVRLAIGHRGAEEKLLTA